MGKIWLKSVDPSRQCCGCEGKTGPCDSCCERQIVYTPKTSNVPSLISLDNEERIFEDYPLNKIYSSTFDTWSISDKSLSFSMNALQGTPYHTNRFAISLQKDQIIEINLNFSLLANSYPSSLRYTQFPSRTLDDLSTVTKPFTFGLIANKNTTPDDLEVLSATDMTAIGGTSNSLFYNKNVEVSENFSSVSNITSYQSTPIICDYPFRVGYASDNTADQAILDSQFTVNRVVILTTNYTLVWDINGFWQPFYQPGVSDCSQIQGLSQNPPVFNGQIVNYFVKGYEFETVYEGGSLPMNPPVGTTVNAVNYVYAIVYTRPVQYMTKTVVDANTIRIKALKSACLYILVDGAIYDNPSPDYPDASFVQTVNGSITSTSKINVLNLDFEEYET